MELNERELQRTRRCLYWTYALDCADESVMPGMFPIMTVQFGASLEQLGALVLMTGVVKSLCTPAWGTLADRVDSRKRMLLGSCVAWGLLSLVLSTCTSLGALILLRMANSVSLAIMAPLSQSLLPDVSAPADRGLYYGRLGFWGQLGSMLGSMLSVRLASAITFGVYGWRLVFAVIGSLCLFAVPFVSSLFHEPFRGQFDSVRHKREIGDAVPGVLESTRAIFSTRTFLILVVQGMFGCIPGVAAGSFFPLFFSYCNFTSAQVASFVFLERLGRASGSCFGGWLGDRMASWSPNHGRILVAQASVFNGIPVTLFILKVVPGLTDQFGVLASALWLLGFSSSWTPSATNRPVQAEVAHPETRASMLSYMLCAEGAFSAVGGPIVAFLSQDVFGFVDSRRKHPSAAMSEAERAANVSALASALCWTMVVPWCLCLAAYSLMHITYKVDRLQAEIRATTAKVPSVVLPAAAVSSELVEVVGLSGERIGSPSGSDVLCGSPAGSEDPLTAGDG